MKNEWLESSLIDFLDGDLDPQQEKKFLLELEEDGEVRQQVEGYQKTLSAVRTALVLEEPSSTLDKSILAAARNQLVQEEILEISPKPEEKQSWWSWLFSPALRPALSFAMLFLMVGGGYFFVTKEKSLLRPEQPTGEGNFTARKLPPRRTSPLRTTPRKAIALSKIKASEKDGNKLGHSAPEGRREEASGASQAKHLKLQKSTKRLDGNRTRLAANQAKTPGIAGADTESKRVRKRRVRRSRKSRRNRRNRRGGKVWRRSRRRFRPKKRYRPRRRMSPPRKRAVQAGVADDPFKMAPPPPAMGRPTAIPSKRPVRKESYEGLRSKFKAKARKKMPQKLQRNVGKGSRTARVKEIDLDSNNSKGKVYNARSFRRYRKKLKRKKAPYKAAVRTKSWKQQPRQTNTKKTKTSSLFGLKSKSNTNDVLQFRSGQSRSAKWIEQGNRAYSNKNYQLGINNFQYALKTAVSRRTQADMHYQLAIGYLQLKNANKANFHLTRYLNYTPTSGKSAARQKLRKLYYADMRTNDVARKVLGRLLGLERYQYRYQRESMQKPSRRYKRTRPAKSR